MLKNQGNDQHAVTGRSAPPAYQVRVSAQKNRATNSPSPLVEYLLPNFKKLTNPMVRQALAVAVNKTTWITAAGGPQIDNPQIDKVTNSVINPSVVGYTDFGNVFGAPDSGDAAKAKSLLQQAGCRFPTRSTSPTAAERRPPTPRRRR